MAEIGSTLREARMRERIDISEVEAQTKIRAKYLRAIENEEWDLLPGPVYAKSFLRTYGDYLGLDSRMLLDEFKRRYERPSEHDARPMASVPTRSRHRERERDRRPRRGRIPSWAPIGIVIAAILVTLYVIGRNSSNSTSTSTQKAATHRHPARRRPAKTTTATVALPTNVTLQLVPTNPVYVCLVDGAGTKLINEQTFNVGQPIPTEKASKLLLTLGNANVQMKVNGRGVPVAPSPNAIRLLITPTTIQHIPASQPPTCP